MADRRVKKAPLLEIQIHPGTVRWGVRYLFLNRSKLWLSSIFGGALMLLVVFGLAMTPRMVNDLIRLREYRSLTSERELQGRRVQALSAELESLASRAEELRLRMGRIFLTYGLAADHSIGQGGYPFADLQIIDSIYAADVARGKGLENQVAEQIAVLDTFLAEVESFEAAHGDQVLTTPSISPLEPSDFVLTSPFGSRRSPFTKRMDLHPGLDLAATTGTPIHAPADGVVVFAGRYPIKQSVAWWRYGNLVAIRHGERFITLFGHCHELHVRNGQQIKQRELIATVGNTGWSTSPHLHYEVRQKDAEGLFVPVDPRIYILDHRWRDEEQWLIRARRAPDLSGFEPLPRLIGR